MNKEEIEELKEFTIDSTDIDELALGLEVCSKKSNMVIQEFIDTIVQLLQENQSLKKENKILRENAEHNDKVVDKVNWENLKLKKQLEEANEELELVRFDLHNRISERDDYYKNIEILENQQKEFIEYLENEKSIYPYDISDYDYEKIINTILSKYYEIIDKLEKGE